MGEKIHNREAIMNKKKLSEADIKAKFITPAILMAGWDAGILQGSLYLCEWNNRIIKSELITDELLKQDFLNWDEQKARYKERLDNALKWMREDDMVPNGWGKVVGKPKNKK